MFNTEFVKREFTDHKVLIGLLFFDKASEDMKLARVAVLGIALGAGCIAAYLAGNQKTATTSAPQAPVEHIETTEILTANGEIPVGKKLTSQDFQWTPWPTKYASTHFIGKASSANIFQETYVTRAPFAPGEPIRMEKLIKTNGSGYMAAIVPSGMRAVSTTITPETSAGGFILPNDRVDVLLTSAEKTLGGGGDYYRSRTILVDVRVLAVDQNVEEKSGQKTALGKIATLELLPEDAEKLALANRLGTISLSLRSLSETSAERNAASTLSRQESINIVRFGQSSLQSPPN